MGKAQVRTAKTIPQWLPPSSRRPYESNRFCYSPIGARALCCAGLCAAAPKTVAVNCGSNHTISDALEKADPGDVIQIHGVCSEKVTVKTDGITLDGQGAAVIQGGSAPQGTELDGLVTVDGAHGVVIRNLLIQRSRAEGVFGKRGAVFTQRTSHCKTMPAPAWARRVRRSTSPIAGRAVTWRVLIFSTGRRSCFAAISKQVTTMMSVSS